MTANVSASQARPAVVIDIETLGLDKKAVVLTLSAFRFDLASRSAAITVDNGALVDTPESMLHLKLNVTEQILAGRCIEPGTVEWWRNQSPRAIAGIISGEGVRVIDAMHALLAFIGDATPFFRGTDFDPPVIDSLMMDFGCKVPWRYNQVRDVRTYIDALTDGCDGYLPQWQTPSWFVSHDSLHDCIRDAEQMLMARRLRFADPA